MSNFCGLAYHHLVPFNQKELERSINLTGSLQCHSSVTENGFHAVSYLDALPDRAPHVHETDVALILYTGDVVNDDISMWDDVYLHLSESNLHWFSTLRGSFAFALIDKIKKQVFLISDHRAQIPLYYGEFKNYFVFSTIMSSFTVLESNPPFNVQWLYEYFFFNFPIGNTTFLENVYRVPPFTVLCYDIRSGKIQTGSYSEYLVPSKHLAKGKEALDTCINTFRHVVPKYYSDKRMNLHPITGGFDSKALLAMAPGNSMVETYTYGLPGTRDLIDTGPLIKSAGLKHEQIHFDSDFTGLLPDLIYKTVHLSGGTQSIIRSTLLYVYQALSSSRAVPPNVLSGLAGDSLFRGNASVPSIISYGLKQYLQTGYVPLDAEIYKKAFDRYFHDFQDHIEMALRDFNERYGNPLDPAALLSYTMYELYPRYFGGEVAIANHYVAFRAPYLDMDLINLAYGTEYSTLVFSTFLSKKKNVFRKNYMQANLIKTNPLFKDVIISGIPLRYWARDNRPLPSIGLQFYRGYARLIRNRQQYPPLEDWGNWFRDVLHPEFDRLLNRDTILSDYMDMAFIDTLKDSGDTHILAKVVTSEILLRLIDNNWRNS